MNLFYSIAERHIISRLLCALVCIHSVISADADDKKPVIVPGSDVCTRDHLARLELVFLIDNSDKETIELAPKIVQVVDDLQKIYKSSKFGINLYSDFECEVWNDESFCFAEENKDKYHHDPDACYTFHEALTEDTELIKSRVTEGKIPWKYSGKQEAGINALMMTGADPRVGWTPGNEDIDVNKIIVVFTDYKTYADGEPKPSNGKPRVPARGDGTDECSTMNGASAQLTHDVLERLGISIFVLLTKDDDGSITGIWNYFVGYLGVAKYDIANLTESNEGWLGKLKDFITDVALSSPRVTCADPPGYLTLGL